ncbi:MAG: cytochrome c nitrite reductase small subunit [Planctomycetota bacterium]|nr:cytochrome c nitrite reductase small subunit [Planctomycetota bacterium]
MRRRLSRLARAVAILIAGLVGFGLYTFNYADGASYLSDDPRACANCHIMEPQFDSWQKASHHGAATCNDCHLPAEGLAKYLSKMENGWNHSVAFTLQNFDEPIRMTEKSAAILQANCLRCHGELAHAVASGASGAQDEVRCVHCHSRVGHGDRAGLGGALHDSEIPKELR